MRLRPVAPELCGLRRWLGLSGLRFLGCKTRMLTCYVLALIFQEPGSGWGTSWRVGVAGTSLQLPEEQLPDILQGGP